ncbi:MAG: hypothetical protein J5590_00935 [Clostridia bacterium]|nr:hypothetical protein [Clostridia bacterium]
MKNKLLFFLLIAVLAVNLSACKKEEKSTSPGASTPSAPSAKTFATPEPVYKPLTEENIQGCWLDENDDFLFAVEDNAYLSAMYVYEINKFSEVKGLYEINGDTLLLHFDEGYADLTLNDVKLTDDELSFVTVENRKFDCKKISVEEAHKFIASK